METKFNAELKRIRKLRGMTQEELAEQVGVSAQAVSKWEMNSFPDAQLLPQIADALQVSIDELYGRGKEIKSLQQQVLDAVRAGIDYEKEGRAKNQGSFEFMTELCRAFIMGCLGVDLYRPIESNVWNADGWETYSQGEFECGIFQSRLPENLHYFLFLPEPKEGYDKVLAYEEEMVELFRFLGKPDALRTMYFLAGSPKKMFFNEKTLAVELGISEEQGRDIIDGLQRFDFILEADFNSGKREEKICQYTAGCKFISFIAFTRILLHHQENYNYQTNSRNSPYFKHNTHRKKGADNEKERKEN